jgi:mono/diheme cytochrome c family protein
MRNAFICGALLLLMCAASVNSRSAIEETLPPSYVPTGQLMYQQYCATCHGADAKGHGPLAAILKTPPSDLTTLARRHLGKFPYEYVSSVLQFGSGASSHGSSDMPTWGPLFRYLDKQNERAVQLRIKNLCNYLATLQQQ